MASYTGSLSRSTYIYVDTTITTVSQDITNNRTLVNIKVALRSTSTSSYDSYGTGSLTVYLDGSVVGSASGATLNFNFASYTVKDLLSFDVWVPHNADGTKTALFRTYINYPSGKPHGYSDANGYVTLATIPRASTPTLSASAVEYGQSVTINTNRLVSSFTHTIRVNWNGTTETIATGVTDAYTWTVPMEYISRIPNAASTFGTIYLDTYNGSSLIGTKTVTLTTNVPASVVPTISSAVISEAVEGLVEQFLAFVQNKSKLKIVTTAAGVYGSTISQVKNTVQSIAYTGGDITTEILTASGTVAVETEVTDTRGRKATLMQNVTVIAYTPPQILAFSAYRSDDLGAAQDEGTNANISINFGIAPVGDRNIKNYLIEYKTAASSTWTELTSGSVYTYNSGYISSAVFSPDYTYDLRLTLTDYFTSVSATYQLPTAYTLMDFRHTGRGLSIGKVSEQDIFECVLPAEFSIVQGAGQRKALYSPQNDCNDNVAEWVLGGGGGASANYPDNNVAWYVNTIHYTDVIRKQIAYEYNGDKIFMRHYLSSWSAWAPLHTEYGSNANGSYTKLPDGTMICTGKKTYPSTAFAPTGNVYYAGLSAIVFPAEFLAAPTVTASIEMGNIGAMQIGGVTTTQFSSIVLSAESTARAPIVRYIAIGRWRA